jgi:hypothetical protein
LALFKKISDWSSLYQLAKRNQLEREVSALYDLSRKVMLTRKMSGKFRRYALLGKNRMRGCKWKYIIPNLKSDDFRDIEKVWKVYLPFNWQDLEAYKR